MGKEEMERNVKKCFSRSKNSKKYFKFIENNIEKIKTQEKLHQIWKSHTLKYQYFKTLVLYAMAIQLCNGMDKPRIKLFEEIFVEYHKLLQIVDRYVGNRKELGIFSIF